jgi:hypothetical protein
MLSFVRLEVGVFSGAQGGHGGCGSIALSPGTAAFATQRKTCGVTGDRQYKPSSQAHQHAELLYRQRSHTFRHILRRSSGPLICL